jgi:putative copper export protein
MAILDQPQTVHLLLHPLPVIGLTIAVIGLVLGLVFKSKGGISIALFLIALCAASAYLVYQSGEKTEHLLEDGFDKETAAWVQEHESRAETAIYLFYVTAFVAVVALVIRPVIPGFARGATWASLALACLCILAGAWIGHAGGRISHPDLRDESTPPLPAPPPAEETSINDPV